jgi:hypothetical protein
MTRINILCAPLDIYKSKLVANIQYANFGKTYPCFVFSTNLKNISLKKMEMKIIQRGKHITKGATLGTS